MHIQQIVREMPEEDTYTLDLWVDVAWMADVLGTVIGI